MPNRSELTSKATGTQVVVKNKTGETVTRVSHKGIMRTVRLAKQEEAVFRNAGTDDSKRKVARLGPVFDELGRRRKPRVLEGIDLKRRPSRRRPKK